MNYSVTDNFNNAIKVANDIARYYGSGEIGTEHILYGLVSQPNSTAGKILTMAGVEASFVNKYIARANPSAVVGDMGYSKRVVNMFATANNIKTDLGKKSIGSEHFLYAMLLDATSIACEILRACGVNIADMERSLKKMLAENKTAPAQTQTQTQPNYEQQNPSQNGNNQNYGSNLPQSLLELGQDLTAKAREGKIDAVIGREEEIERIIQILCRKTKNNPVLVGEPGVGKSAVVEGLALAIVEGKVPYGLINKKIFSLDIASLVAGTKYRGALEEKLKGAIEQIKAYGDIVVFIDEIHTLAQAGGKEGDVSPADILKPYLARGEFQTLGATTIDEYRKYIERDKALERRFQPVTVNPPSVDETIRIIRGLRANYEKFHKVAISDEAIVTAVKLADRYIADRFFPDKAIDIIDEAMAKAKVENGSISGEDAKMMDELEEILANKEFALKTHNAFMVEMFEQKAQKIKSYLNSRNVNWYRFSRQGQRVVTEDDIAQVVSTWAKVPVSKLSQTEAEKLMNLEKTLHKRVIGQHEAVETVAKAVRRARAGLKDPNRPIGSFLFLGPTGVGKTELTKALCEAMFDDENAVVRIDMSEYMESHSVSKLIGAPPGYAGFGDGGQLTEAVRRKPYCVVLFDEVEKAHPDIFNLLLQVLDDGRLTDSQGRVVSFKNTIIIMTSNAGVTDLKRARQSVGFGGANEITRQDENAKAVLFEALKKTFRPEFINRIDTICYFHSLTRDDVGAIAGIMLDKFATMLMSKGIELDITPDALEYIVDKGYDVEFGARPLRRVIEQEIEDAIAEGLVSGALANRDKVTVDLIYGEIKII